MKKKKKKKTPPGPSQQDIDLANKKYPPAEKFHTKEMGQELYQSVLASIRIKNASLFTELFKLVGELDNLEYWDKFQLSKEAEDLAKVNSWMINDITDQQMQRLDEYRKSQRKFQNPDWVEKKQKERKKRKVERPLPNVRFKQREERIAQLKEREKKEKEEEEKRKNRPISKTKETIVKQIS
jgi:hypothetical protein